MNNKEEIYLDVDDYLDLYLLAGKLGDSSWRNEINEKLKSLHEQQNDPALTLRSLLHQYNVVNMDMIALYQQFRKQPYNDELRKKIWELKQQRMHINRQIHFAELKIQRQKP